MDKDKKDIKAGILFFIIIIGIGIFQRDSARQQKKEELSAKIIELQNELDSLQENINDLESFIYNNDLDTNETPYIGDDATYEAYDLAQEIYDILNNGNNDEME